MLKDSQLLLKHSKNPILIEKALLFAEQTYGDTQRYTGELFSQHAISVALILQNMGLDATTIAAALLHDTTNQSVTQNREKILSDILNLFGNDVRRIISKNYDINKIYYPFVLASKEEAFVNPEKAEQVRRMFLAISGDLRSILIELASRIDGLKKINEIPEDRRRAYATETLQIFVPIAHRLGLSELRRNLEDACFAYLFPEKFAWIKAQIKEEHTVRERHLKKLIPYLKKILKKEHVEVIRISYRTKSYWSSYQKLLKYNMDFSRIHDLLALRIITKNVADCYKILGIVHKYFKPLSEEINDFIAKPKLNGYRSLHTTIFSKGERITEIQIRTEEMDKEAEYGICAHWSYKEKIDLQKNEDQFKWTKEIPEFWKTFKINFFENQIFAFTPKGDIINLPRGSTVVDFAYAVHSEIGNHCESAKIAGKIVPLTHTLQNGDIVEITVNKNKGPSRDWLKFVKTNLAKSHIKKVVAPKPSLFKLPIPGFIRRRIIEFSEGRKKRTEEKVKIKQANVRQLYLAGQKGILIHKAKCCNPVVGDKVKAYLSKNRAVLHKTACKNFKKIEVMFPEKIIDASWR